MIFFHRNAVIPLPPFPGKTLPAKIPDKKTEDELIRGLSGYMKKDGCVLSVCGVKPYYRVFDALCSNMSSEETGSMFFDGIIAAYLLNPLKNDYDAELTKKAAVAKMGERFELFAHHPFYAARFFTRKYITQWADPVCISTQNLDYVSRHHEISALGNSIVFGVGSTVLAWIMNVFMTLCYLGVVVYLAGVLRKRHVSDYEMLMLLLIFGGMVFHEFWEGSSRYAMRYYIYQLPFAACGLKVLLGLIHEHKLKKI